MALSEVAELDVFPYRLLSIKGAQWLGSAQDRHGPAQTNPAQDRPLLFMAGLGAVPSL
ncbi:UNVERIFIED_CONTAM: hypothetical protein Slati_1328100 [Sesamum latifolium]|uniref:Uncharacterized protein n=1 Tax=Sesamum latifolium TaxID=2727402 RepID=A0AAW2XIK3_9LAMI